VIFSYIRNKQKEIREGNPGSDLLTQMMTSIDSETGQGMGSEQLRDEAVSILLAGFETTGHLIPWVLGLLLQNPDSLRKLRNEIDSELKGAVPSAEDAFRLGYLNSVFDETLRLYPSAWAWTKRSLGEDRLGEVQIKKGEILFVSPYLVHRDPSLWTDPDRFNPDRWTSELRDQNKGAYFPFGLGPRTCVGKHFALLEAKLIVIRILQGFDFDFIGEHALEPHFQITLGLKIPLQVRIRQRSRM
jgi:cytochrome P450